MKPFFLGKILSLTKREKFALSLMDKAEKKILKLINSHSIKSSYKDDGSFVSDVDKAVELFLRREIKRAFPNDGIIGEEFPHLNSESDYTWSVDPIDGTSSLVHNVPLFASLLGLTFKKDPVMGLAYFPALDERIWAFKGKGCFFSKSKKRARKLFSERSFVQGNSIFSHSGLEYFEKSKSNILLSKLQNGFSIERCWGDAYGHCLVAKGNIDFMIDPILKYWDWVPLVVIIQEAGCVFEGVFKEKKNNFKSGISRQKKIPASFLKNLLG